MLKSKEEKRRSEPTGEDGIARTGDSDREEEKSVSSAFLSKELGISSSATFSGTFLIRKATPEIKICNTELGKGG